MYLEGKTAVITGSGRGIGRSIALELAKHGCNIGVNFFRNRAPAEETANEIAKLGAQAIVIKANVGQEEAIRGLVDQTADRFGGVDIFVGNAASGVAKPIMDVSAKEWDWTLNINARSVLFGAQTAANYMRKNGWGRIITLTSGGGRRVFEDYGVVGVSKAAIEAATRYLAVELRADGIVANCISAGLVDTDALNHFPDREGMLNYALKNTPAQRLTTPEEVAQLAAWLCTDQASMIVGQTIEIDGGFSIRQQMR